ncbi:MAG TPA: cytochrome c biogenesis protein CcdA, partial [Gemmatimonadales bacterium]|nr:cytochrome c biogenesis protein CcdA [Gemmatimonadales bacterium]
MRAWFVSVREFVNGTVRPQVGARRPMAVLALALSLAASAPVARFVAPPAHAQMGGGSTPSPGELMRASAAPVSVPAGGSATVVVSLDVLPSWHVNANPPALDYNIPTTVTLSGGSGLTPGRVSYPAGKSQKFGFEETPLLVYDGTVQVRVPLTASLDAKSGTISGSVEFQACNDEVCLPPASVAFAVAVTVTEAVAGAPVAVPDTAAPAGTTSGPGSASFSTAPPVGGASSTAARSELEKALSQGGLGWFLALFVGGLLLNLTPCVFPMLGVTVSIFGARRQEPLPKVFSTAVLYVLGICVTYTALGVVAALTGGLFGAALQSVWVSVVLGGLMLLLSLGMFGLYEMQPPAWMLDKLGGAQATNFAGAFLSGLGVGVIAAPCVGPFVVAVLALIAQKGDVLFGVQTMFTLSLGLGFPYLFLATFSNLLQALPRSGDWMVWVKHVFGLIMAAIGLYYILIGLAPDLAPWVLPVALIVGGAWLGFLDHSSGEKGRFKAFTQAAGLLAVIAGVVLGSSLYQATTRTLKFQPYDAAAVQASVAAGRPVMMDFSADWCVPCHELELVTFTDPRVVAEAKKFDRYKVDLTKYDSAEANETRKRYGITGVPTIVFLGPDGQEIVPARVEGFLPPEPF